MKRLSTTTGFFSIASTLEAPSILAIAMAISITALSGCGGGHRGVSTPLTIDNPAIESPERDAAAVSATATCITKATFFGDSSLSLGAPVPNAPLAPKARAIYVEDINGDGNKDMILGSYGQGIAIYKNNGNSTISLVSPTLVSKQPQAIYVSDVDRDGDNDIIVADYSVGVKIFKNNGTGAFSAGQTISFLYSTSLVVEDLNGSNGVDIVVGNYKYPSKVCLNSGTGTFTCATTLGAFIRTKNVIAADVDRDGKKDIVQSNYFTPPDRKPVAMTFKIWKNSGAGTFTELAQTGLGLFGINSIVATDVEKDGDDDILVSSYLGGSGTLGLGQLLLNNSSGIFTSAGLTGSNVWNSNTVSFISADFDGDTYPDIAMGDYVGGAVNDEIWYNDGAGKFKKSCASGAGIVSKSWALFPVDIDGDSDIDIVDGAAASIKVWLNGGGTLSSGTCSSNSNCSAPTPYCINPGTQLSACIACRTSADCDDSSSLTTDVCISANTSTSSCSHISCPVACSNDAACADTNMMTVDTCSNPGTCSAACSHSTMTLVVTASVNPSSGSTSDSFTLTCSATGGTIQLWEAKCSSALAYTTIPTGTTRTCSYAAVGTYTASCRANGSATANSAPISITPPNALPTATASATPTSGNAPVVVTFTGGCTDTDGSCVSYSWNFGDGTTTSSSQNPTHTYTIGGTLTATLTVTDNRGGTAQRTVSITITAPNVLPTATASGSPTSGDYSLAVAFTGGCSDTDGTCVSYSWNFGDGSAASSSQNPSHTYTNAGIFTARLTVTDNRGGTAQATVTITTTAPNVLPNATASGTPTSGDYPRAVAFTGGCSDTDGTCVSYSWNFGDGSATSSSQNPSHTYTTAGTFTATLTVTDNRGGTDQATVSITITAPNVSPTATASATPTSGFIPQAVSFTGACADSDGTCVSYSWNFGDGSATSSSQNPSHTYSSIGTFTATLTVTDNRGGTDTDTVTITVGAPNSLPDASSSASPTSGDYPLAVSFTGGCSDSDGSCVSYSWNFGDGSTTSSSQNPSHTYTTAGTFTATLTVTDNRGGTDQETETITVTTPNVPPTATASGSPTTGNAPIAVTFTGGCSDTDGTCVSYSWTFGDGSTSTSQNPSHTYATSGSYTATLTVTDNRGGTDSDTVSISTYKPVALALGWKHTCGLTSDGAVKCWGYNSNGQLGDGTITDRVNPTSVTGLSSGVSAIGAGSMFTCALTTGGGVKCWGVNNFGQLGDGTTTDRLTPVNVLGLTSGVSAIAMGGDYACALTTAGGMKCWGYNNFGQLGDGTTTTRTSPVNVTGLTSGVISLGAGGGGHNCAIATGGALKCWGYNFYGQIGDNTQINRLTPVAVAAGMSTGMSSGVVKVVLNVNSTYALKSDGRLYAWGHNLDGQIGIGSMQNFFKVAQSVSSSVSSVSAGLSFACLLTTTGGAKCWGLNDTGQVGDNSITTRRAPVNVTGLTTGVAYLAVSAPSDHFCILTTATAPVIKCWGSNSSGQLGDGTGINRLTSVSVVGF